MDLQPATIDEVQAAVREHATVRPRGAGTKTALSAPATDAALLDVARVSGVLEYEPAEFTFTALAGTRLGEVADLLAQHGQHLPFDPPLVAAGATLGGTVAAGLSGPGRYRYGGVRDFILSVRYVDGAGELVRGGGKVVKNAAGFDLPKLMVGSLGRLGVLVELTFKVFPRPQAYVSLSQGYASFAGALSALQQLYTAPLDLEALDLVPGQAGTVTLWVRLAGLAPALPARADRVRELLGGGEVVAGADEAALWRQAGEFAWVPPGWWLAKVPLTPARAAALEAALAGGLDGQPAVRWYSAGANVAWVATPAAPRTLDSLLSGLDLSGLLVLGPAPPQQRLLGQRYGGPGGQAFYQRVKQALDPDGRFGDH